MLVVAAMSALWISPMLRYWGAAFGPLRPFAYGDVDVSPSLAMFGAAAFACLLPWWLPRSYYDAGQTPAARRLYERLGVRLFRRVATNGDLINRAARRESARYRVIRDLGSAGTFVEGNKRGERGHLILLCAGLATAAHALSIGWFGWAIALTAGNTVFNLYPILLLRYNRARVRRTFGSQIQ